MHDFGVRPRHIRIIGQHDIALIGPAQHNFGPARVDRAGLALQRAPNKTQPGAAQNILH